MITTTYKGKHLIEAEAYSFRGLVQYLHSGKQGNMQEDRCKLHIDKQITGSGLSHWVQLGQKKPQSPTPQLDTSSNKAIPTPTRPHLLKVPLPLRVFFF